MKIRKLQEKDSKLMLAWMHDESVTANMATDFSKKSIEDVQAFIKNAKDETTHFHRAIVNDEDEYMGTVSLKHIDINTSTAEFAIVVSREAVGRGYAWYGMKEIIQYGFVNLGLECIYWCVSEENKRAVRFYEKHGFHKSLDVSDEVLKRYEGFDDLRWYSIIKGDLLEKRTEIAGCPIINITTYPTLGAGELSFFEEGRDIPFDIKRIYYISKVPEGTKRGFHAHKSLKQILFCPYGKILIKLMNSYGNEEIELSDPSVGILIDKPTWREMTWLKKDSVLCVAASEYYDSEDYIRDKSKFVEEYINEV